MFLVFDKQKIYSYFIAFSTVIVLFAFAFTVTGNKPNAVLTSTSNECNVQENIENNTIP